MSLRADDFKKRVRAHYKMHGRHTLPWRKTKNPYRILVSEIMLQQTQVDRVIPKYRNFLKKFPTVITLSQAALSDVLKEWQGLGYNRRAKMLHDASRAIVMVHEGRFPKTKETLMSLPGIGPYTASAVRVFAFNKPDALIETNVRAVFIHHFFPKKNKVPDSSLMPLIVESTDSKNPREWYSALMDYGAYLKKNTANPSRRSTHHVRQKPFKGSNREVRGAILKMLARKTSSTENLFKLPFSRSAIETQYANLLSEGLISFSKERIRLG